MTVAENVYLHARHVLAQMQFSLMEASQGQFVMDNIAIEKHLLTTMMVEGERSFPHEACGLIVALNGKKSEIVVCENVASNPKEFFRISATDYARAASVGSIIGMWHTHCNRSPDPSDADKVGCERFLVPWYILGVNKDQSGRVSFVGPTITTPGGFAMPYEGRPYIYGVFDCYTLVMDYYLREFGIALNDYPRVREDGTSGITYFTEKFVAEGFVRLGCEEPMPGDVFMIQMMANVPDHLAIYVGDGVILHHNSGRLSKRDPYAGYWKKHTVVHVRHSKKC